MNSYSWLQKKLHQIALSSKFIREATFDIENLIVPYNKNIDDKHVFVAGLARSGSTILLNAIYDSNLFASSSYLDMPFILAPNLWKKLPKKNIDYNKFIERSHKDGVKISIKSPEAFEEVFWKTFEHAEDSKIKFERFVNLVTYKYKRKRYLSKNNQNIRRVNYLSSIFPNSKILIPFRDPIQQATSLLLQHNRFNEYSKNDNFISDYMKWIGHTEFGPNYKPIKKEITYNNYNELNHWIEQWILSYEDQLDIINNNKNILPICHEMLIGSHKYWLKILNFLEINSSYYYDFRKSKKNSILNVDKNLSKKCYQIYDQLRGIASE